MSAACRSLAGDAPSAVRVVLSPYEYGYACTAGYQRHYAAMKRKAPTKQMRDRIPHELRYSLTYHSDGVLGEIALAKGLGLYWDATIGKSTEKDVAGLQARYRCGHGEDMYIHRDRHTCPDDIYVLVTGETDDPLTLYLRGWIMAREVMTEERWDAFAPRPAYRAPQALLKPMEPLKRMVLQRLLDGCH